MSREHYLWCIVDRYLSSSHISYTQALECARRDVYEIPEDKESLEMLASRCVLSVENRTDTY